ncbi:hypothetical protein VHEMI00764 [[Torrubiella] hemipterigena]|uniref:FAM86A protein n=1 Tax=[Torrubiella] hemipterigena TaxID=1531966 RepID=A0A0A1SK43_9HYPO|nr:hypothetical protein VHEMI00764 [[Torrubiella] hemipterigena]
MEKSWKTSTERFCSQYLQLEDSLDFPPPEVLQLSAVQDYIHERLFADGAVQYGPPLRYQSQKLKQLLSRIEASIDDWDQFGISDDLMASLSMIIAQPLPQEAEEAQQKCYVNYSLSLLQSADETASITLLENRFLIAASGTTGLRTWEAALHMGQFLCGNKPLVHQKRILELGAGTGYLSILCSRHLGATHVIASDGSDDVVNNLPDNLFLNSLQESENITPMDLKWGYALLGTEEQKWNGGRPVDVVIGADITYDKSVIPSLISTLEELFDLYPSVDVYISATQRNADTFQVFLDRCREAGLLPVDMEYGVPNRIQQGGPFYNDKVNILIYRICKDRS